MNEKEMNKEARKKVINRDYDIKKPHGRRKDAIANRTLLLGDVHNGTDFAPYNQVLSTVQFEKCETALDYLRNFYIYFYPYINHIVTTLETTWQAYDESLEEQDKVLKTYADLMHEKKLLELFVEEMKLDYTTWKKKYE